MRPSSAIFIAAAAFAFTTASGFAQEAPSAGDKARETAKVTSPGNFIDENNNGICDNFEARNGRGRGANFVDRDGDGICDHRQDADKRKGYRDRPGRGKGYGYRHGWGKGQCCGQAHRHRHGWQNQETGTGGDQQPGNKKD